MSKQFLGRLDVDAALPEQGGERVSEGVESDLLCDGELLQSRPDLVPQNRFRRDRLGPVLLDRWEDEIRIGRIERFLPPLLQRFNHDSL